MYFHLLSCPSPPISHLSASCLSALSTRRLTSPLWSRILTSLPPALQSAPSGSADFYALACGASAGLIANNVSKITDDKTILPNPQPSSPTHQSLSAYLSYLVALLQHPSGHVSSAQVNMWVVLCRDPQISKSGMLRPYMGGVTCRYMEANVRREWEEEWDDEESYEAWINEFRGKVGVLVKLFAKIDGEEASRVVVERVAAVLGRPSEEEGGGEEKGGERDRKIER